MYFIDINILEYYSSNFNQLNLIIFNLLIGIHGVLKLIILTGQ